MNNLKQHNNMIQANELRIGNKVKRNGIIVTADFMTPADCFQHPEQYNPIPITPEILDKSWFLTDLYDMKWIDCTNLSYMGFKDGVLSLFIHSDKRTLQEELSHIQYIHQLQNLYYSLTGEELNITI